MGNIKKIFLASFSLFLAIGINSARADVDDAILFKITNITPVKNSEEIIHACDFSITFYNRSAKNISGASVDMVWEDNSLDTIIKSEEAAQTNQRTRAQSRTSRNNPNQLTLGVNIPSLKANQQTTVKTRIQTDRCFILLSDVATRVKSCRIEADGVRASEATSTCANMFRFVSPQSEDFYSDFKDISAEKDAREMSRKEKLATQINDEYQKTLSELESAKAAVSEIK